MIKPILTIMIPTTIDRKEMFLGLMEEIQIQVYQHDLLGEVEVIWNEDDKQKSVGRKRQLLLEEAKGEWVVGIDSDDWIHEDYIKDILLSLKENPNTDHVGFLEECDIDGEKSLSIFSIRHKVWDEKKDGYDHIRCANPKSVIRRTKALEVGYQDLRYSEDRIFSEAVTPLLTSEVFINKPLYIYRYTSTPHNERYGIKD